MQQEDIESQEHATDLEWAAVTADIRMVERGYPVADIVEEDS